MSVWKKNGNPLSLYRPHKRIMAFTKKTREHLATIFWLKLVEKYSKMESTGLKVKTLLTSAYSSVI